MNQRARQSRPWCFWGERPGFRKPEWIGRILRQWKLRPLHTSSAPIWGIGKFAVDQYKREFGLRREYFNLPYFSNLERFNTGTSPNGDSTSERVFVYSGSLIPRKGVDVLARSFETLVGNGHKVRLKIVGGGPLRDELQRSLSRIGDRVDFVGFKDWRELPEQYAGAQVLCVPSRYDGWGLVVPEGLAAGLPVIATDRMGAALEFVETGRNGWLVRAGDQGALTSAMTKAATISSHELSSMSAEARASVREHTLENGARRFLQYANDVVTNWQVH
jgi:glycosyltransferase involved in cell wall biosynthesis